MNGIKHLILFSCTLLTMCACSSENGGDSPSPSPSIEKIPIRISTSMVYYRQCGWQRFQPSKG